MRLGLTSLLNSPDTVNAMSSDTTAGICCNSTVQCANCTLIPEQALLELMAPMRHSIPGKTDMRWMHGSRRRYTRQSSAYFTDFGNDIVVIA